MDRRDDLPQRLPLPSEDEGDLVDEPGEGETTDPMVATEEGVPWVPPTERVLSGSRVAQGGPDVAASPASPDEELEAEDAGAELPRDEALLDAALAALRGSDLTAGDRIEVDAAGSTVFLRGEVESLEVADEINRLVSDLPGVQEVVDELEIASAR